MLTEKKVTELQKLLEKHKLGVRTLRATEEDMLDILKIPYPSLALKLNPEITPEQVEEFKKAWMLSMNQSTMPKLVGREEFLENTD